MNAVLDTILRTGLVDDGERQYPLDSHMSAQAGALIGHAFALTKPDISIEVGVAYGISTLYACQALADNGKVATHIAIDPTLSEYFHDIAIKNIKRAGLDNFLQLRPQPSEIALPELLGAGTRVQAAIIDGVHTLDHALVDFFYINKMLDVGGIVILDDTNYPGVTLLIEHIRTYPAYEFFADTGDATPAVKMRSKLRRALIRWTMSPRLRRSWDYPRCMAFRKIHEDTRRWDWHVDF